MKAISRFALLLVFAVVFIASCGGSPPEVSETKGATDYCTSWGWCEQCVQGCAALGNCPDGCRWANPPPVSYPYCDCRDNQHSWCEPNPASCIACNCGDLNHSWCDQRAGHCYPGPKPWPVLPTCDDLYGDWTWVETYYGGPLMPVPTGGGLLASCKYYDWYYHVWNPWMDRGQCSFQAPNRLTGEIVGWRCVDDPVFEYNNSSMWH